MRWSGTGGYRPRRGCRKAKESGELFPKIMPTASFFPSCRNAVRTAVEPRRVVGTRPTSGSKEQPRRPIGKESTTFEKNAAGRKATNRKAPTRTRSKRYNVLHLRIRSPTMFRIRSRPTRMLSRQKNLWGPPLRRNPRLLLLLLFLRKRRRWNWRRRSRRSPRNPGSSQGE